MGTMLGSPSFGTMMGGYRRSFWTKRKKTAMSLLTTLALLAGIAVAFKLFDQTVPNNVVRDASVFDYLIEKNDPVAGDTGYEVAGASNPIFHLDPASCEPDTSCAGDIFPGDTRSVDVRISNINDPARDASFEVYISEINVIDYSTPGAGVWIDPATDPRWARFVNYWTFAVDKQLILTADGGDIVETRMGPACEGGLREFTANNPCKLGIIKATGSSDLVDEPMDQRDYEFKLTEADDGSNQSAFKGWYVDVTFVFNARVPAEPENTAIVGER